MSDIDHVTVGVNEAHTWVVITVGNQELSYEPSIALGMAAAIIDAAHLPGDTLVIVLGDQRLRLTNDAARDLGAAVAAAADQLLEEADFQF